MTTILVDQDLCTRCGICSVVCTAGIISPADENNLPRVNREREGACISCGHCEAFCPSQALLLNISPDERVAPPAGGGTLDPVALAYYIRKRRSVRQYTADSIPREKIFEILEVARYAPSGGNRQPVEWIVVYDPAKVQRIAGLTIDWMRTLAGSAHPLSGYVPGLIRGWESGNDVICRGAPHLLAAHIPEANPAAMIDAIIAMTHFDIAAPAFGVGTCWAGFVAAACREYPPLREVLEIPKDRSSAYAMMFGYPRYDVHGIPRRKPLVVSWR
jgi:nitroreductase/NAD-dependent dihydropyrimidine dehydrogenase PreA subunit